MTERVFDRIKAGLEEALAHARGELTGRMVRITHYRVEAGAQPPEGRPEKGKAD